MRIDLRNLSTLLTVGSLSLFFAACGQDVSGFKSAALQAVTSPTNGGLAQGPPVATPPPSTTVPPAPSTPPGSAGGRVSTPSLPSYKVEQAPLWESARPKDGSLWTQAGFGYVDTYGDALIAGTSDIKTFCPTYFNLTRNEKINFWVYLASAIAKYESGFNPASRYLETTLGTDSVTHQPVWSEGLLQLSYQDTKTYTFCDEFDWARDSKLSAKDASKTILDPYKNLRCGLRILNYQVNKKDLIAVRGYWSTLFPTGSKISPIRALAKSQKYCQP